jgi:predicted transposase/invertase (TIGR01784 family)
MEKLVRFDWAIKKMLRSTAYFYVVEGFLSAFLREKITIVTVLSNETSKEYGENRLDLVVENSRHELLLILLQANSEYDFFRIAYGTARIMGEQGQPYRNIKQIISLHLSYCNIGVGKDYLYYGSTAFVGVQSKDLLVLTEKQSELFGLSELKKIFPEYYLIRINAFPDKVESPRDEWMYMLKNCEVRPEFTAQYIQDASALLRLSNLDEEQRRAYEEYLNNLVQEQSMLWSFRNEGKEEGKHEAKLAIAQKLLTHGLSHDVIAESTGLTTEEIGKLSKGERR